MNVTDLKKYVIHVKTGYEDREESIRRQFAGLGMEFEWILDFDVPDLDDETLRRSGYHGTELSMGEVSCSMKHIAAWRRIAADGPPGGFVFEDDIIVSARFDETAAAALTELEREHGGRGYLSLGDGCAMFVPWTRTSRNRLLYPAEQVRATDSYYLSAGAAAEMVGRVEETGFFLPADHLINRLCHDLAIPIFWLAPTIVSQGSHTGRFRSALQSRDKGGLRERLKWLAKKFRRKYLYPLLGRDERIMSPGLRKAIGIERGEP